MNELVVALVVGAVFTVGLIVGFVIRGRCTDTKKQADDYDYEGWADTFLHG